jgi:hypothetical protein
LGTLELRERESERERESSSEFRVSNGFLKKKKKNENPLCILIDTIFLHLKRLSFL